MATAISKPTSHAPKMKRPPPPFSQPGVNGVKPQQPSSSPSITSKRLPGSNTTGSGSSLTNGVVNVANAPKGPLRTRPQGQRPSEQTSRMGRPVTRTAMMGNDNQVSKRCPEPYGCLIVRVVDHKSVSAQARKNSASPSNENNTPFSLHNYNEHVTPSAFVPYPKQNQLTHDLQSSKPADTSASGQNQSEKQDNGETGSQAQGLGPGHKNVAPKPKVFTTVLHPTARVLQAELTLLVTTPDPKVAKPLTSSQLPRTQSSSVVPQSPAAAGPQADRPAKRQKTLVDPQDLPECESLIVRALAPPLYLDPVDSFAASQDLLKFMESPLHSDPPPSPKRRKRTVAELAADEALAAEEERFMLIMDERLEPTASGGGVGSKAAAVDDAAGVAPFEPRFSRFKTLETIRMQLEEKAKREHEMKLKQELAKRQQQEQERERRRAIEQRQAEEHAKEEARRQQLAAQQAQAQIAAQQNRHVRAQANGVSQGQQSSPVVRNQTPHATSSPLVGNTMATQAVPMSISASQQSGSPPRPPSSMQHTHPNVISHPMAASRSQQGPSRHGTPQMTQGTPAMSHATPIMRNVTPTQRMGHGSPNHSTMSQTPMMNQAIASTPQMNNGMGLTPQQQMFLQQQQQRQQLLAQQGQMGQNQFTPQQIAQLQANAHAQQNIHQQQMLQQQQNHQNMQKIPQHSQQAYQTQLMRAQFAQMQMVKQQQQGPMAQGQPTPQHHSPQQMTPQQQQQQQLMMAAAQANGGQMPNNMQNNMQNNMAARYNRLYQQRLLHLRHEMSQRCLSQYGPPNQYPPQVAQQYGAGLEKSAKTWVQDIMRREREAAQQQRATQAAMQAQQMQQQNMMHNGMGN
ncbi:Spt20 family [Penicillium hispanicum]|uniref:Spt20 family n=1 Tax=Penicillium hispanicum TaxID=1080232 RepID=UPI002541F9E5|nr:Spt20 family [Penicillium hispanicum]KAJ5578749.1 Spt20 family [Penicillium hispanicum]